MIEKERISRDKKKYTDLRVIDMHLQNAASGTLSFENDGEWITLGHFDRFCVRQLEQNVVTGAGVDLSLIQRHNQELSRDSDGAYIQPIYILRDFYRKIRKIVDAFWSLPSAFLLVSRVHTKLAEQTSFEDEIIDCLRNPNAEDGIVPKAYDGSESVVTPGEKDIPYLFYRTLEFSDIILIAKANSVENLLKLVGRLYYSQLVGDVYSYFGISSAELRLPKPVLAATDDRIPYTMTRFAVRNARKGVAFLQDHWDRMPDAVQKKMELPILITGMEDLMLISKNLRSSELCLLIGGFLSDWGQSEPQHILHAPTAFWDAFDSMTTRLSIDENSLFWGSSRQMVFDSRLFDTYDALYKEFLMQYQSDRNVFPDWLRPTVELLKSLRTISQDYILRQVCYTVLDGVRGIVVLGKRLMVFQSEAQASLTMLQMASNGISNLMEHMIRMEGELVHHPETRPLLYDIPANLLELYLSFSDLCLTYYQQREPAQPNQRYLLLLVPCLCSNIAVKNVDDNLGSGPYGKDKLLYVEIPLRLLYEPKYVLCSLIHEIAHFSGEEARKREERFPRLCFSVASQMSVPLKISDNLETIDFLRKEIEGRIPGDKRNYSELLRSALDDAVIQIVSDKSVRQKITFAYYLKIAGQKNRETRYRAAFSADITREDIWFIHQNIEELIYLYRESYADLAMVSLLQISAKDYLHLVEKDLKPNEKTKYPCAVERAAVVVYTLVESITGNREMNAFAAADRFTEDVQRYLRWLSGDHNGQAFGKEYHNYEAIAALIDYLKNCFESICEFDKNNAGPVDEIRSQFNSFAKNREFASLEFYQILEQHREKQLEQFGRKL